MFFKLEKEWVTEAGFLAKAGLVNDSHYCGYVAVAANHPLFGVEYYQETNRLIELPLDEPLGKRSPIVLLGKISSTPEVVIDVHGGITFSGMDNHQNFWWFGFDCAHDTDLTKKDIEESRVSSIPGWGSKEFRDLDYVTSECESLAEQLKTRVVW